MATLSPRRPEKLHKCHSLKLLLRLSLKTLSWPLEASGVGARRVSSYPVRASVRFSVSPSPLGKGVSSLRRIFHPRPFLSPSSFALSLHFTVVISQWPIIYPSIPSCTSPYPPSPISHSCPSPIPSILSCPTSVSPPSVSHSCPSPITPMPLYRLPLSSSSSIPRK